MRLLNPEQTAEFLAECNSEEEDNKRYMVAIRDGALKSGDWILATKEEILAQLALCAQHYKGKLGICGDLEEYVKLGPHGKLPNQDGGPTFIGLPDEILTSNPHNVELMRDYGRMPVILTDSGRGSWRVSVPMRFVVELARLNYDFACYALHMLYFSSFGQDPSQELKDEVELIVKAGRGGGA